MNLSALLALAENQFLPAYVAAELFVHPTATDAELQGVIEGDLKHFLRSKIGWAVDILWSISPVKSQIDTAVSAAIASARGTTGGTFTLPTSISASPIV